MRVQWHSTGKTAFNPPFDAMTDTDIQYWDWGRWAASPETSPIFDGSETSMSGQGEKVAHNSNGQKPAGQGGGCIASGPFKDMKVNLGYAISIPSLSLLQNIR